MKKSLLLTACCISTASAATISVNLTEGNANQQMATTTTAGIDVQSNWNNTSGANGTAGSLTDSTGAVTGASVTWSSAGTCGDGEANTDANNGVGNAQVARGYLDDGNGGSGVDFTVSGITYATYTAHIYFATDTNGGTYRAFDVNGTSQSTTGTKNRYGTQPNWDATNSITVTGLTGNLVLDGLARDGANRGSVAGFQIVDTTPIPEPSSTALLGLGGLALILRRRK